MHAPLVYGRVNIVFDGEDKYLLISGRGNATLYFRSYVFLSYCISYV